MASVYPGGLDSFATNKANATTTQNDHPDHHNDLADAVNKIEAELGIDPAGSSSTVVARLDSLDFPQWLAYLNGRQSDETGDADDDFFTDASLTGWTAVTTTGTVTWTEKYDLLSAVFANQSSGDVVAQVKAATGGVAAGDSIQCGIQFLPSGAQNYYMVGLAFADGTAATSNAILGVFFGDNAAAFKHAVVGPGTFTNIPETYNQNLFSNNAKSAVMHLRFTYVSAASGGTWRLQGSPDGVGWTQWGASDSTGTLTPTHVALVVGTKGAAAPAAVNFQYFRYNPA